MNLLEESSPVYLSPVYISFPDSFSAINHWFGVVVVETGDEFSIIYIYITIVVINVYSKVNNISNFIFHLEKQNEEFKDQCFIYQMSKTKQDISN